MPDKQKKLETNEANISQELKTTMPVLCYNRLRHMLPKAKYSQNTTKWKERPKCRKKELISIKYTIKLRCNTSEQPVLLPKLQT